MASKLTQEECDYLIGAFFKKETEETLCEKMEKCRSSLRDIKKSCLLKLMVALRNLEKKERDV